MFPSVTPAAFSPSSAKSGIKTIGNESFFLVLLFSLFYCILLQNVEQMTHVNIAAICLEYYSLCLWFNSLLWHFPHHWLTEDFTEETIIWVQPCVYTHDSCLSLNLNYPKLWLQMFPGFSGPNVCKRNALTSLGKVKKPGSVFVSFKDTPAFHQTVG